MKQTCLSRPLSPRRNQVLQFLGQGLTERQVAQRLGITLGTLRNYLVQIRVHCRLSSLEDVRRLGRDWVGGEVKLYAPIERERF